jgi:hypothetical protein
MRANRVVHKEPPETLARRAVVAGIEREKEKRRVAERKPDEQDSLMLRDETGARWKITVNAQGQLTTVAMKEGQDGTPARV